MVLVALAALGAGLLTQHSTAGSSSPRAAGRPNSVAVGGQVLAAQAAGDRLWIMTCVQLCGAGDTGLDSERLVEVDASSGAVIRRLPPLTNVIAFALAGRDIWVAHFLSGVVTRIDPASGMVTASVHLRLPAPLVRHDRSFLPSSLSSSRGYLWVSTARGQLAQIDERTGRLLRMVRTPSENNTATADRYGIWMAENLGGIGLLAPHSKRVRIRAIMQAGLPLDVNGVLSAARALWAVASPDTTELNAPTVVLAINPHTDRVIRRVHVPTANSGAVVAGGALYLADFAHGHIYRVSRDGALETFSTPRHQAWLATASPDALWAATSVTPGHKHGRLLRISLPRG